MGVSTNVYYDDEVIQQQQQQPCVNRHHPPRGPSHPGPPHSHSQHPQQYPQFPPPHPQYTNTIWPHPPQATVTQSQMQYSQFQQQAPYGPSHGRSQSQQVYQHQYQSLPVPQVQARPPPSQQYFPPSSPPHSGPSSSRNQGQHGRSSNNTNRVISAEEDIERLFYVCKSGRGNASLLHEALVYAKPDDLKEKGVIQEFLARCRSSQDLIFSQITWATAQAERSRRKGKARSNDETKEERLLAELLGANEELLDAIKMYTDLERVGIEQGALERVLADQKLRSLNALTSFKPTPTESAIVDQIFDIADTRRIGSISSHAAVKIFSGSRLSPSTLADIWRIANVEESDMLGRQVVGVAVRLIGHAQKNKGQKVSEDWVDLPGAVADIEGLEPTPHHGPIAGPSSSSGNLPPLTPEDRDKFMKIFVKSTPADGVLNGDRAREVLMKSRLPLHTLGQIWELADVQQKGYLDATAFVVAMYLIQASMSGHLKTLPQSLPSSIYFDASLLGSSPPTATSPLSPMSASFLPSPVGLGSTSGARVPLWDVTSEGKATSDEFFNVLDEQSKGYIEGKIARAHFLLSGLPEREVKRIWKLVDINGDGRLGRDEFAVALHLIKAKQNGVPLPRTLPDTLIPPSLRGPTAGTQEESLIDLADPALLPSIPALQPTFTGLPASPTGPRSPTDNPSPHISGLLAGLPSASSIQFLTPQLTSGPSALNRGTSEPSTRPPTTMPTFPSALTGFVSQPNLPSPSPSRTAAPVVQATAEETPSRSGWTWGVTPAEKASSDRFFDILDPWRHGYIEGEAAVPFMSKSKLPESDLAKIWDLADADKDGRLSKDDFAVAMHLIKAKLAGSDIPARLPISLVPPSPGARIGPPPEEPSPFDDPVPEPTVTALSPQVRRDNGSVESPLPSLPPPPAEEIAPPAVALPPEGAPRSQTPPPPYALVDAATPVDS